MTQEELVRILKRWQKRIRLLRAWNIAIRFATPEELKNADWDLTYGCVPAGGVDVDTQTARIVMRPPETYGDMDWYSMDECVLHELGHIIFDNHRKETAINTFAETVLNAYPRDKKRANATRPHN